MNRRKQDILIGSIIILIGVFSLLSQMDFFYSLNNFIFGALFLIAAGYFIKLYAGNRKQWWRLLVACVFGFLGAGILLESFLELPGSLYGILLFLAIASSFAYVYGRDTRQWWAVIPSGISFTLATLVLLNAFEWLSSDVLGVVFLFGTGLTFLYLWAQRSKNNKLQWAVFPAAVFIVLSVIVYIDASSWLHSDFIFPLLLIIAGILLILNTIRLHHKETLQKDESLTSNKEKQE
ncbi:MAG: hypothetical protein U5R06_19590 [candidate division KSB1 bacterium]|nr:hypothetical protein [candidate division KSB1 bacterium]